jgi:hypothetical protein
VIARILTSIAISAAILSEEVSRNGKRGAQSYKATLTAPAEVSGEEVDKARAEKTKS